MLLAGDRSQAACTTEASTRPSRKGWDRELYRVSLAVSAVRCLCPEWP